MYWKYFVVDGIFVVMEPHGEQTMEDEPGRWQQLPNETAQGFQGVLRKFRGQIEGVLGGILDGQGVGLREESRLRFYLIVILIIVHFNFATHISSYFINKTCYQYHTVLLLPFIGVNSSGLLL